MDSSKDGYGAQTFADYLRVVSRYRWTIIVIAVIVPVVAYLVSASHDKVYQASSEVLIRQQDLGTGLTGIASANVTNDPERYAETQAALARVPTVAQMAIARAHVFGVTADDLLGSSSVSPSVNADLLTFTVDNAKPEVAANLAGAYAEAFTEYALQTNTASLKQARDELQGRLKQLADSGDTKSALYRSLGSKVQDLRTIELLETQPTVVRTPTNGFKAKPIPRRAAELGLILGILLGLGAAFLRNALDRKPRGESEVESLPGIPLLARLGSPFPNRSERRLSDLGGLMNGRAAKRTASVNRDDVAAIRSSLNEPSSVIAEGIRRLRTNLELANI